MRRKGAASPVLLGSGRETALPNDRISLGIMM